ncbi:hypothetical protein RU96_GL002325 [Enterococcus canintestini]|uniref:Uncharacterized protein n=2 Tax=Enterococcus canintestini TaxID=317010 RepID=A0A1L8R6X5_9ENTE|nr:hypothetical protein RU96_GL002325 [Enterococcus canintestini]
MEQKEVTMQEFLLKMLRKITALTRNGGAANGNTLSRNAYGELEKQEQKLNASKKEQTPPQK